MINKGRMGTPNLVNYYLAVQLTALLYWWSGTQERGWQIGISARRIYLQANHQWPHSTPTRMLRLHQKQGILIWGGKREMENI